VGLRSEPRSLRDTRLSDLTTYLTGAPTTAFTGFKRFVKFMSETGRMDWDEADNILRRLHGQ
jgi:hypothetical protein